MASSPVVITPDNVAAASSPVTITPDAPQKPWIDMAKLGQVAEKGNYGAGEFANPDHPAHAALSAALDDIKNGYYARGAHGLFNAAAQFMKPAAPLAIASPVSAALGAGGSFVGSNLAQAGAQKLGATPEQAQVAGDVGGMAGGGLLSKLAAVPERLPGRLYQSALKPSTRLSTTQVQNIVNTGLEEHIPVSPAGVEKLGSLIDDLNDKIAGQIKAGAAQGATVNKYAVASRLGDTAQQFSQQVTPNKDLSAIARTGNEFLANQPAEIPVDAAQAMKQGTYQQIRKSYGQLSNATIESQKALARGIKEELATQFPEIGELNARESQLLGLDKSLEQAVRRIENHNMIGIGTPIATGAAGALTGSKGIAGVAGLLKAVIDDPSIKSRLAIALEGAGKTPSQVANSRLAAYVSALESSANARPQSNQTNSQGSAP